MLFVVREEFPVDANHCGGNFSPSLIRSGRFHPTRLKRRSSANCLSVVFHARKLRLDYGHPHPPYPIVGMRGDQLAS
jgi:hypothetical protein